MSEMKPLRVVRVSNAEMDLFQKRAAKFRDRLMRHRDRYVKAWLAATGLGPEDCVLVTRELPMDANGAVVTEMFMRRKDEAR